MARLVASSSLLALQLVALVAASRFLLVLATLATVATSRLLLATARPMVPLAAPCLSLLALVRAATLRMVVTVAALS
jgi:hypothetical protein